VSPFRRKRKSGLPTLRGPLYRADDYVLCGNLQESKGIICLLGLVYVCVVRSWTSPTTCLRRRNAGLILTKLDIKISLLNVVRYS
jgi:hypothetical protein